MPETRGQGSFLFRNRRLPGRFLFESILISNGNRDKDLQLFSRDLTLPDQDGGMEGQI